MFTGLVEDYEDYPSVEKRILDEYYYLDEPGRFYICSSNFCHARSFKSLYGKRLIEF